YIEAQIKYAKLLMENTFAGKIFFCNSGAEANEGAIKLARKWGNGRSETTKNEIITMRSSFHGRTLATVTATGQEKFQKGFEPLPEGFCYVPFNDIKALSDAITERTCAVMLEPIQAEGGIRVPDEAYLADVRNLCSERQILMILDEVQVGMGRTGRLFAYENYGITPDIMTLAKALGNGFPIGAMIASQEVASCLDPGSHASTFGGNPLAMAAALATLTAILGDGVLENTRRIGDYFQESLGNLQKKYAIIREVRGKGLLIGVEMEIEVAGIIKGCMEKGLLAASAGPNVLRFVPPLSVTAEDIDRAINILDSVLEVQ
ncbi:MAG: acetylornithine/succinylornithine family transaminase, partial [Syntrophales bacterium]|nr:acetylornithine/succinylornithine family transaminase [Syntrophales bacterium]